MRKRYWVAVIAMVMGAAGAIALAADGFTPISNLSGQSCGADTGTWHFVNNQTRGHAGGLLSATWSSSDFCTGVAATTVNRNNQHFFCVASGELTSAFVTGPGRLVLSDVTCDGKEPPPPCDPKTQKCD